MKTRLKFLLQKYYFRKNADVLIVEGEHVKERLKHINLLTKSRVHIVHNAPAEIFLPPPRANHRPYIKPKDIIKIGFLGRNYTHKNTSLIPEVSRILNKEKNRTYKFFVTFNDEEWQQCSSEFRNEVENIGPLTLDQCPTFYREMDAIIFPSLLECFSVTPIEAMMMECPVLASDRAFVRDFCKDYPFYFDPLNPDSAKSAIEEFMNLGNDELEIRLNDARNFAITSYSAKKRSDEYIKLIRCYINDFSS